MDYQERLKEKELNIRRGKIRRITKTVLISFLVFSGLGLLGWGITKIPRILEEEIISRTGIHWHPELSILIKGIKQEVPAEIGIGAVHNPIHTHDATGIIHLEFEGLVTKKSIRLEKFFEIWKKTFNQNCIFDNCNGVDGTVKFLVNGQLNNEFEKYVMQDGDKIEIRYE